MLFWLKKFVSFWVMPLPFCLTLMAVGLVLLLRPRFARLGRALLLTGLVLLAVLSNSFVSKWLIRPLQARYPAVPELTAGAPLPPALAACRYVVVLGGGNGYSPGVAANNLLASSSISRAAEGVRLPAAALLVAEILPPKDAQRPVVVNYKREYESRFLSDVSTFGGHAYDGLMLAVEAIKRAKSTDKAMVRDAIEGTKGYMGTAGMVNMSAKDHMGLDNTAFRMLEVRNGSWTLAR